MTDTFYAGQTDYIEKLNGLDTAVQTIIDFGPASVIIRNGDGPPDDADGNNGDYYIDYTNSTFYGPKTAGLWGSSISLIAAAGGGGGGGGASVWIGTTAPSDPSTYPLWWKSNEGHLKVYYDDGDSQQWVDASPSGGKGDTGPTGPTGATGAAGADGAVGPAGVGVLSGGTFGQVLTKQSSTDYDTAWADPPSSTIGSQISLLAYYG